MPLITGLFLLWLKVLDKEDLEEIWLVKRISSSHFKYSLEFVRLISSTSTPLWFSIWNLIFKNCLPSFWMLISSFLASLFFWLRLYINPFKILIKCVWKNWLKLCINYNSNFLLIGQAIIQRNKTSNYTKVLNACWVSVGHRVTVPAWSDSIIQQLLVKVFMHFKNFYL